MIEYAVMPLQDYKNACDAIRLKIESTYTITSNELPSKIDEVFNAGQAEGSANATILYGTYVIKENITFEEVGGIYVDEDVSDKNIYAYFYDNDTQSYQYKKIIGMMFESQRMPICWYTDGMQTALVNGKWECSSNGVRGNLPNSKGRIIVFTEPTFITTDFYNAFTSAIDEGFDIFADGKQDGIAEGIEQGIEQGAENEKKRFWGIFQERTNWLYAFYQWRVDNIDPTFDVIPINASNMFNSVIAYNGKNLNIPEIEARNNIKFDFSKCTNFAGMMSWGAVEDLGFVDMTAGTNGTNSAFSNSGSLKRLSIAIKEDGSQNFSGAFDYTSALEDLTVVSGYFGSNLNFQWATKFKKASFVSVISHLLDSASGLSVTFSKTACDKAFETANGANDGSTSAEWLNLIATKPNWSIKLV